MPNRILRDWTDSLAVNSLTAEGERFFTRLIMKVDDFGRFSANPRLLSSLLFPLKDGIRDADSTRWLNECELAGLLLAYTVSGQPFLEVRKFGQRARAEKSKYPPPPDSCQASDGQATDRRPSPAPVVVGVVEVVGVGAKARAREDLPAPVPNFRATFLAGYPECPNKGFETEAEHLWASYTDVQRAKCLAARDDLAKAVMAAPKSERRWVWKPFNWMTRFGPDFESEACRTFDRGAQQEPVSQPFKRPEGYYAPRA